MRCASSHRIAVLTSSNAVPHFFPGVKTEVFHGFDAGKPRHIYIRGFFDLYCTTGPRDTRAFETKARELGHFAVHETGWPKLDPFMRLHGAGEPPPVRAKPAILYHSTFSPSWSAAPILYETIRDLSRSGRWQWIVTLHPKSDRETVERYRALEGEHLRFATEDNILDLFPQVDMMISDTSSALNEFLLTYKPVVTFKNRRPGPQLIDIDKPELLLPSIERALARPPELMDAIREFADSIHPYRDGRSSERVLDAVDQFIAAGARNARAEAAQLVAQAEDPPAHPLLGPRVSADRRGELHGRGNQVPISPGELVDKITILEIKSARMTDPAKARERAHRARSPARHLAHVRVRARTTSRRSGRRCARSTRSCGTSRI